MTYLLDTHVLLWWLFDDRHLSKLARGIISDPENRILVSSASVWEIATKYRLGKLPSASEFIKSPGEWISRARFKELPISVAHAHRAGAFPQPHRDPFDRMLAAQSLIEEIPLIGRDDELKAFGARLVW